MSYPRSASCVTCETRNKKCDGTKGPTGCRRCVQAGLQCGGYLAMNPRIPKPKHSTRETQPLPSTSFHYDSIGGNEIPGPMTLPAGPSNLTRASRSVRGGSAGTITQGFDYLYWSAGVPAPQQPTNLQPVYPSIRHGQPSTCTLEFVQAPVDHIPIPLANTIGHILTPPLEGGAGTSITRPRTGSSMAIPSQAHLVGPRYYLSQSQPIALLAPDSPGLRLSAARGPSTRIGKGFRAGKGQNLAASSQPRPSLEWPMSHLDDEPEVRDPENLEAKLLNELILDRQIESNTLPFLVHGFTSWSTLFIFEATQILPIVADHIRRSHSYDTETRQTMLLISNASLAISRSTDYDLPEFTTLQKQLIDRVVVARGDTKITREVASATMQHSHQFMSMLFKVGSLASVLSVLNLYGPIFRRACPGPGEGLVNLPRCFTTMDVHLKHYAALDILQSVITHRPMCFRYDLDYLSPQEEGILKSGNGMGLRWLYGVSDRLMIVLARMNSIFEDFGTRVDSKTVQQLEQEIAACTPIVSTRPGADPILNLGRIMVQESWMMAARVYLYMGLCGANPSDPRVVRAQKGFMRLLGAFKSRRNPDSFLVLPIAVLGVATTSSTDQTTLLERLSGVSECNRPGTVGNDIIRMLNDIWARTAGRPAVWADLRSACLCVTGI